MTSTGSGILQTSKTFAPEANDGAALGVSGRAFSDAFFATGAVLDFNAGADTIIHSANKFTFNTSIVGGSLTLPSALPINCRTVASVNFNSANTDTSIPITLPPGYTRYRVNQIIISGASASIGTATWGLFTAAAGGGVAISAAGQATGVTSAAENTAANMAVTAPATLAQNTTSLNAATLFFRVGTAQGSPATATVTIIYSPVS